GGAEDRAQNLALGLLDPLGDLHLSLAGQQGDGAHLPQVHANGVAAPDIGGVLVVLLFLLPALLVGIGIDQGGLGIAQKSLAGHLGGVDDGDVVIAEHRHEVVELVRRDHVGREAVVDVVVGQEALLTSEFEQGLELLPVLRSDLLVLVVGEAELLDLVFVRKVGEGQLGALGRRQGPLARTEALAGCLQGGLGARLCGGRELGALLGVGGLRRLLRILLRRLLGRFRGGLLFLLLGRLRLGGPGDGLLFLGHGGPGGLLLLGLGRLPDGLGGGLLLFGLGRLLPGGRGALLLFRLDRLLGGSLGSGLLLPGLALLRGGLRGRLLLLGRLLAGGLRGGLLRRRFAGGPGLPGRLLRLLPGLGLAGRCLLLRGVRSGLGFLRPVLRALRHERLLASRAGAASERSHQGLRQRLGAAA